MGSKNLSSLVLELILGIMWLNGVLLSKAQGDDGMIRIYDKIEDDRKHFVLVHGACHGAWIWYKLKPMLEAAGHKVTTMDLEASGIDLRRIEQVCSVDAYSRPLLEIIAALPKGEKVVLVGDSMGGINAAVAMENYPHKIAVAVFLNAFIPDTKHKPSYVLEMYSKVVVDWKDCKFSWFLCGEKNITTIKLGPQFLKQNLYQLSSTEDLELAKALTRVGSFFQADLAVRSKFTMERYGSVPRTAIISKQDKAIPAEFQRWEIENFGVQEQFEVDFGDHLLMLSNPEELLRHLQHIARKYA
ncbi:alpha-hydroxynitrile lyase-like [Malania oleifera]|uniref:alpha-hydroxynitrile lyase-like n=1 Tax=Malania oleifera TaxID=397392 RepID=UPI0025AE38D9|nr:alpha-hydroxynitrile lyase-like [Malania oleifera]